MGALSRADADYDAGYDAGYAVGGWVASVLLAVVLIALILRIVARYRRQTDAPVARRGWDRSRIAEIVAAVLVGVVLVNAVNEAVGGPGDDPWDTRSGRNVRAGFLDGCRGQSTLDCQCLLSEVRSVLPEDTPARFLEYQARLEPFAASRDPGDLPPDYVAAVRRCAP